MPALHECGICRAQQAPNALGACTACGGPLRPLPGSTSSGERRRGSSSRLLQEALDEVGQPPAEAGVRRTLEFPSVLPVPPLAGDAPAITNTVEFPAVIPIPPPAPPPAAAPVAPPAPPVAPMPPLEEALAPGAPSPPEIVHTQRFDAVMRVPAEAPSESPSGAAPAAEFESGSQGALVALAAPPERAQERLPVLVGIAAVAVFVLVVLIVVAVKGTLSTGAALKAAQAAQPTEPLRALQLIDQAGLGQSPRAEVQLVRARAALALGQDAKVKDALALAGHDGQASKEDLAALAAIRGTILAKDQSWKDAAASFDEATHTIANDAALWRALAQARLALRDDAGAETAAGRGRDLAPGDVGSRVVLARCALLRGELAKGLKELEGLATDDAAFFLTRAELKLRRDEAESALADLGRIGATSHELHLLRAAVLLATNDLQGSLAEASAADADLVPGDTEPRRAMARALLAEGRGGEALRTLDDLARKAERDAAAAPGIASERAIACLAVDDLARAETVLQQAGPVPAVLVAERARRSLVEAAVALACGKAEAALAAARRAAQELDDPIAVATGSPVFVLDRVTIPSSRLAARAWAIAARSAERAGQGKEKAAFIQKAMEGAPDATDILTIAAVDKLVRGDLTGARIALEEAARAAPRDASIRAKIGSANVALQNWDDARRSLEEAIKLGSSDPLVFLDLSRTHLQLGKADLAASVLEEAREKGLDPGAYAYARARLARARSAPPEQQEWLERAIALRPFDVSVLEELADVKAANGHASDAATSYEALLKLDPGRERWLSAWVRQSVAAGLPPATTQARLELAIKRLPRDPALVALRGHLLLDTDVDAAIRELEAALAANDKQPEAALDLAVARIRAGAPGAGDALSRAYKLADTKDDVSLQIEKEAQRFRDKGQAQWERAILAAEALIANDPRRRSAHLLILELRHSMKDWRQLWESARRAEQYFPNDKAILEHKNVARRELDLLDRK